MKPLLGREAPKPETRQVFGLVPRSLCQELRVCDFPLFGAETVAKPKPVEIVRREGAAKVARLRFWEAGFRRTARGPDGCNNGCP